MDDTRSPGSRALRCAAFLTALLAAGTAAAETPVGAAPAAQQPLASGSLLAASVPMPPPPAPAASAAADPAPARRTHDLLGLQLDLGLPDLAGVSVLYRPLKWMRFEGGMLYNYAGYGVRGGVSVLPHYWIAPSLTLEAGHYFDANAYAKLSKYTTVDDNLRPLLEKVGYTFVNASAGLELGNPNGFVFFVRAGVSKMWLSVHNAQAAATSSSSGSTKVTVMDDPSVRLGIPNVKLGFMIFFW